MDFVYLCVCVYEEIIEYFAIPIPDKETLHKKQTYNSTFK